MALDDDRQTYAAFPPDLKAAMKAVASGYGWGREDWMLHTQCCQDALLRGVGADVLADGYRNPHPSCLEYRLKRPETAIEATK